MVDTVLELIWVFTDIFRAVVAFFLFVLEV